MLPLQALIQLNAAVPDRWSESHNIYIDSSMIFRKYLQQFKGAKWRITMQHFELLQLKVN